ncbi:tiggy-winkle hedgehog protein [Hydra vulgaris]|uniref:tiggy-winkle hedgehog protein n=1 Tax=Hydra vulgaris TaxID=6087 RepID=UPI001F5EA9B9|nr:tiggy-winkle hedgehog protein [Hydra vulgaris]
MSIQAVIASKFIYILGLILVTKVDYCYGCGVGRRFGHAFSTQPDIETHYPNAAETSELASGFFGKKLLKNDTSLRITINTQIIYQHHRLDSESRLATAVCTEALLLLSESVQHHWSGEYKLYVIEGYLSDATKNRGSLSLHLEGRAFDLRLANSDPKKPRLALNDNKQLQRLAGLAYYQAKFSYVSVRHNHVHVSCRKNNKIEENKVYSRCFPETAYVRHKSGKKIMMRDLKVGDSVITMSPYGKILYSEVTMFLHKQKTVKVNDYIKIATTDGKNLVLSSHHLIFTLNQGAIYAKDVQPNIYITSFNIENKFFNKTRVSKVSHVSEYGVYSPLTEEGTIIVNDVYVSCYAMFPNHRIADLTFSLWRFLFRYFKFILTYFETDTEYHWYPNILRQSVNFLNILPYEL